MTSEVSRLRRLLTARGDYWDLSWDLSQLERAWRNEVVTLPPLRASPCEGDSNKHEHCNHATKNQHWNFIPKSVSVPIPQAKVYLRDKIDEDPPYPLQETEDASRSNPERYHIYIEVLSFEEAQYGTVEHSTIETSLYVVKGNPLIVTTSPLPCFASGIGNLLVDIRPNDDISSLFVQAVITNFGAHMAVPLEELIEYSQRNRRGQSPVERSITMWDTQSGKMRGSALVQFRAEREEPHSYSEIISIRKSITEYPPPINSVYPPIPSSTSSTSRMMAESAMSDRVVQSARNHSPITSTSTPGGGRSSLPSTLEREKSESIRQSRRLSAITLQMAPVVPALNFGSFQRQDTEVQPHPTEETAPRDFVIGQSVAAESPQAKTRKRGGVRGFAIGNTEAIFQSMPQDEDIPFERQDTHEQTT